MYGLSDGLINSLTDRVYDLVNSRAVDMPYLVSSLRHLVRQWVKDWECRLFLSSDRRGPLTLISDTSNRKERAISYLLSFVNRWTPCLVTY